MKKNGVDADFETAFFKEVDESVKNDNLKKLWDKYGLAIIIFVAVVLTVTVSFESFKAWRNKQMAEVSNAYTVALALQNQGKYDESSDVLKKIEQDNDGIYGSIAELQLANVYLAEGKKDEAMNVLRSIVAQNDVPTAIHDIAVIKLASYLLDTAPATEIEELLAPLNSPENEWQLISKELLALLALRENNADLAIAYYAEIANAPSADERIKSRARDMISVLEQK